MNPRRAVFMPFLVLGTAVLLGGWFLQEGVARDENVYVQVRVFQEVVDHISSQYVEEVDEGTLYESAIDGMLDELGDPNSSFIPARAYESFQIRATTGEYGGVGLEVVERDGRVTVVGPIPGTPAARAGIRPGDWFVEIGGEDALDWDVDRAVDVLRGEPGTSVGVKMGRPGVDEPIPFTLTREVVQLKAVPFAITLDDGIGYVPLQVFRSTSTTELRAAIDSLRREGAEGLVLDLRGNPGGLLEEGIAITELFVGAGSRIVETRGRAAGQSHTHTADQPAAFPDLPLVVLIDGTSASAAEIVAGALQDHDRALVVGMPSYGKGSVQSLLRLTGGNVLRLTTALWYTPVGRSIERLGDEEGIPPVHASLTLAGGLLPDESHAERPTYESMAGRTLLGGGGIVPDVEVVPDTLTVREALAVRALYEHGGELTTAMFSFAVEYNRARPALPIGFRLDEAALAAFHDELVESGIDVAADVYADASRYLRYQLERQIALQAHGDAGEFLQGMPDDVQLRRALDLIGSARSTSELLGAAGAGIPEAASAATAGGPSGS